MRKKRRITKTAMVKKWFLFLAIVAGLVTSCKDYDDDIDRLDEDLAALETELQTAQTSLSSLQTQISSAATDSEVDAAVAAAKSEAIDAAEVYVDGLLATLKGNYTGTLEDLNDEIMAVAAQLAALGVDVTGLAEDLDAAELEIATIKEQLDLQQAVLDKYLVEGTDESLIDAINEVKEDLAELQEAAIGDLAELQAAVDAFEDQINAIDAGLNVLSISVNSMITNITLLNSALAVVTQDPDLFPVLYFTTTVAKQTLTFASGVTGAISFVDGERLLSDESSVVVQVSPANADLSQMLDKIYLIDSEENTEINDYVHAVKAERYTDLLALRSAPTHTGLWKITFQLPAEANFEELEEVVSDEGDPIYLRGCNRKYNC